jgi:hypothetical protein
MTSSGLAAQPSQSLENISLGTRRSMGQFIPQYRTDGQYWIDHTKTWACVRKGNWPKRYEPFRMVVPGGPTRSSSAILRKPSSEKPWGLWGKIGQRSLERSACLALLVRKPARRSGSGTTRKRRANLAMAVDGARPEVVARPSNRRD